ncbi:MAG TPA: amino acid permease [Chlamydiales bacterium]|nr:amino acid permease [Chlamydiales bacterium]
MAKRNLYIKKSLKSGAETGPKLRRHLGPWQLTGIGIGGIIGSGIFVVTGQAAAVYAGPAIILSFVISAIICLLAGLCYAELSSMIPLSGGSYSYAYVTLGEFPAWLVGCSLTTQYLISAASVAVGWSGYFVSFLKDFGVIFSPTFSQAPLAYQPETGWQLTGALINVPAILLVVLLGILVSVGIRAAALFNNIMVFIKIAALLFFILLGFSFIHMDNFRPFIPTSETFGQYGWSGILRAAGLLFYAYIGFDMVPTLAQEAKKPQTSLPKGVLGSLGVSAFLYILTAIVLTGVVSYKLLNVPDPMAVVLNAMGPKFFWFGVVMKIAIIVALASVLLIQLLSQTRVFFAIGNDGLIPKCFSRVNSRTHTPLYSTIITSIVILIVSGIFPINILAELVSIAALFLFAIVCLGVLILRYTYPEMKRSFKVPLVPFIPILGIICCVMQMFFLSPVTWIELASILIIGLIIYFTYSVKHSKLRQKFH